MLTTVTAMLYSSPRVAKYLFCRVSSTRAVLVPLVLVGFVFVLPTIHYSLFTLRVAHAQEGMTFTITPPIFQVNLDPGQTWSSSIRVVNGNPYTITVYANPTPFEPEGEEGRPRIVLSENTFGGEVPEGFASWIRLSQDPIVIPGEQTAEIPFTVVVPQDAAPGGHYAAVLIGNRPPQSTVEGGTVNVASTIASLFFLTVSGDVVEKGRIRDFVTEKSLYEVPEARFSLRFENQGNVHLQPQGNITIYNMFGKKRGHVPLNQGKQFGNVLPGSIRKFSFSWKAESGTWDIGRYKAEATLGYGKDAKQFAASTVYFYVLPVIPLIEIVGGLLAFVFFLFWGIRAYVRRALALETARYGAHVAPLPRSTRIPDELGGAAAAEAKPTLELRSLMRPLQAGMVDLRQIGRSAPTRSVVPELHGREGTPEGQAPLGLLEFVSKYRFFFIFLLVVAVVWLVASAFLSDVLTYERAYEIQVAEPSAE